ncbi:MAG: PsiF family protein [Steroidobacteraceae bacterium]
MRFATVAAAVFLSLLAIAGGLAAGPPARSTDMPAAAAPGTAGPAAAAGSVAPVSASNDAAAKHAKRTACLKSAKTKKLIGADKTAFLKSCIAAP